MKENTKKLIGATATPLASIFGSGFLVIVPILNGAVGPYAWLAMACVCGLAYAMGSVIRFNIRTAEPFPILPPVSNRLDRRLYRIHIIGDTPDALSGRKS